MIKLDISVLVPVHYRFTTDYVGEECEEVLLYPLDSFLGLSPTLVNMGSIPSFIEEDGRTGYYNNLESYGHDDDDEMGDWSATVFNNVEEPPEDINLAQGFPHFAEGLGCWVQVKVADFHNYALELQNNYRDATRQNMQFSSFVSDVKQGIARRGL